MMYTYRTDSILDDGQTSFVTKVKRRLNHIASLGYEVMQVLHRTPIGGTEQVMVVSRARRLRTTGGEE